MSAPDLSNLPPEVRAYIEAQVQAALVAAGASTAPPKELTPEEKVDAALARVHATLVGEHALPVAGMSILEALTAAIEAVYAVVHPAKAANGSAEAVTGSGDNNV